MFSSNKNKKIEISNEIETLIGENCHVIGCLEGSGLLKIDGCVDGDTNWSEDINLGITCDYNGNISCKNAIINGKVKGNICCSETLTIENCGKILGDIVAKHLVIKQGGILDGKCSMLKENLSTELKEEDLEQSSSEDLSNINCPPVINSPN